MLLEICASNYQSALNAQQCGIKRIELCSELVVGGVTPSYGLLKKVMESLSLEVMVLIRPRSGDFNYAATDFDIMKQDIQLCKELGCHGIVSGVLNADRTIDVARTKELIELSKPLPFIFHRAFDHVPNQATALETLVELGVTRILTSGGAARAADGLEQLKNLKKLAANKLTIMPGGGVNAQNITAFQNAGFSEIHASVTHLVGDDSANLIPMNSVKNMVENSHLVTAVSSIKELLSQC